VSCSLVDKVDKRIGVLLRRRNLSECLRIGIGGGTGSGKSTVAEEIRIGLQPLSVEIINLDRFFKPEHKLPKYFSEFHGDYRPDFNAPDSLRVDDMVAYCQAVSSPNVAIFEGHFALYYPEMRALMDVKCYVDADETDMLNRRTRRNLAIGYGGGQETISAYNRECVVPRHREYILPTRRFADIVVPNGISTAFERCEVVTSLCKSIQLQLASSASSPPGASGERGRMS
jgi:uridine kinase